MPLVRRSRVASRSPFGGAAESGYRDDRVGVDQFTRSRLAGCIIHDHGSRPSSGCKLQRGGQRVMVAPKPVPPGVFRKLLEERGFKVIDEDVFNWVMAKGKDEIPLTVPKLGDLIPMDVMMRILSQLA